jgi:nucleoside-diphosphate-sugar epimerase
VIYITGATGFIGERLARRLLERGDKVRCLVRAPQRAERLQALGAELMVGELTDEKTHLDGLRGATLAYHLAAVYDLGVVDDAAMTRTNVEGTRAFLSAVRKAGTPRAVYTSTTVALGPSNPQDPEPRDAYAGPYPSQYHRTKAEAHRLARTAQEAGLPLVIVCPANVYGPGDNGPGGRFIRDLVRRRMPGLLTQPARFSYVHVDDVVDGLIAAGERGKIGETYLLTGESLSVNDFAQRVTRVAGVRAPFLRFPTALASATGVVMDAISRPTGLHLPISRETVATAAVHDWHHTHERATRDLGYAPRSLEQGLPETVAAAQARA